MRLKKRGFFAVMLAVLLLGFGGPDANAAELFVAPDGDDANPGTKAKPFATLERARDAARELKPDAERRIVVRGGTYYNVSLVLEPADSGLAIEAAAGETPVLYGGRRVTGWQKDGEAFYAAKLPGVKERTWDFRVLVVNGGMRPRSRLPETGEFVHLSRFDARWHTTAGGGFRGADKPELKLKMQYKKGDLGPWLDVNNAELIVYHMWDDSVVGLKSHDPQNQTLAFSSPTTYPPGAFGVRTYAVWNVREGMRRPGQWYLDRTRGMVVYWPLPGEDMAKIQAVAPTVECVIRIEGTESAPVAGVTLRGLGVSATTTPLVTGGWAAGAFKGAVEARFARGCRLFDLRVAAVGGQGIRLRNCAGSAIERCEVTETGAGGIYDLVGVKNRIADNRVVGIGRVYASAIGIRVVGSGQMRPDSHDNVVCHNEVRDAPYAGIEFEGLRNRYESNLVHEVMKVLKDGGAFYGAGRENVIRGNVVRGIPPGKQAHAYYIDELGHGILVENNVAINCSWPVHVHLAHDNTFRNNLFVAKKDCKLTFPRSRNITIENTAIWTGGTILVEHGGAVTKWDRNVFFSRAGRYHGLPGNAARRADPLFVDGPKGDLRFKEDSPALKLGIEPLGMADVGPRKQASPAQPKQEANGR
jgi:hypothetical protein